MGISQMIKKHNVTIATIVNNIDWVITRAREIDLDNELFLARELDIIMKHFKKLYSFAGVSSNNMFWNLTQNPIRVIHIPISEGRYSTIVNPKVLKLEGKYFNSIEACGSVPENNYMVKRKPYVSISGYTLEKKYLELEYGSKDFDGGEEPVLSSYYYNEWVVQHEMDHLDGITVKDKGTLFDLNSLMG
jgi:peptide deformylase